MRSFRVALALRTAGGVLALTLLMGVVSALALRTLRYRQLDGAPVHLAEVELRAAGGPRPGLKRERSPAEYRETLERCREEVIRLTRVATDLLTLARSEAGLSAQDQAQVDLPPPRSAGSGSPCRVRRQWYEEILPSGRAITLEIESGDAAGLSVRNEGFGVPPADQAQLFNRVFRGDTRPRDTSGTGLGLAIATAAAEAHGGSLEFVGDDPGAVFRLVLPAGGTRSCE